MRTIKRRTDCRRQVVPERNTIPGTSFTAPGSNVGTTSLNNNNDCKVEAADPQIAVLELGSYLHSVTINTDTVKKSSSTTGTWFKLTYLHSVTINTDTEINILIHVYK